MTISVNKKKKATVLKVSSLGDSGTNWIIWDLTGLVYVIPIILYFSVIAFYLRNSVSDELIHINTIYL